MTRSGPSEGSFDADLVRANPDEGGWASSAEARSGMCFELPLDRRDVTARGFYRVSEQVTQPADVAGVRQVVHRSAFDGEIVFEVNSPAAM